MLTPRIILKTSSILAIDILKGARASNNIGINLLTTHLDRTPALNMASETKRICLQYGIKLLLDDLEIAALVKADGVCCDIDDEMYGRAKDVLGEDKLAGGTAHTIQDVANLFEEGMVDFVILESFIDDGASENILGKQKAQAIIEDARIMGYNIPIILAGGIDGSNADEVMSTGAYGIITDHLSRLDDLTTMISKHPIG
jgi:thiamine-phosphate pyrophosphorylase